MINQVNPFPGYIIPDELILDDVPVDLTDDEKAKASELLSILFDAYEKFQYQLEESSLGVIPSDEGYEIVGSRFISDYRERELRGLDDNLLIYCLQNRKSLLFVTTAELRQIATERGIFTKKEAPNANPWPQRNDTPVHWR